MSGRPFWDLTPCGTPAAYRRHRRNGEKPCAACKRAEAQYNSRRWADKAEAVNAGRRERYAEWRAAGLSRNEAQAMKDRRPAA